MKKHLLVILSILAVALGCKDNADLMNEEEQATYVNLVAEETGIQADLDAAIAAKDGRRIQAAKSKLEAVEKTIALLEEGVVRRVYAPWWAAILSLPVVGPYAEFFGPFAASLLLPLVSRRGRKHYWSLLKNLWPLAEDANGEAGVSLLGALGDVGRALGLLHSTPAAATSAGQPMGAVEKKTITKWEKEPAPRPGKRKKVHTRAR